MTLSEVAIKAKIAEMEPKPMERRKHFPEGMDSYMASGGKESIETAK